MNEKNNRDEWKITMMNEKITMINENNYKEWKNIKGEINNRDE